jgi:cell division protein ZapE
MAALFLAAILSWHVEFLTMPQALLKKYDYEIASGKLQKDAAQRDVMQRLSLLAAQLLERKTESFLKKLFWISANESVRGLYIWGAVGRGKTMLMDMFFADLALLKKRRVHFHAFMRDVHERIFKERQKSEDDALTRVADALSREARLLCFDELAVTNVADAMILSRLFTRLFAKGVVVVSTSNMPPEDLYKDGLNRPLFEPFIALLGSRMDIVKLDAKKDFRLEKLGKSGVYFTGSQAEEKFEAAWSAFLQDRSERVERLYFKERILQASRTVSGACRFDFAELCEAPLSAEDYLELASDFHTLFLKSIPCFQLKDKNALRRFIDLIDVLYDSGVKLVASAPAEPQQLVAAMDGYEAKAFDRTASRLVEMRSEAYLTRQHLPPSQPAVRSA